MARIVPADAVGGYGFSGGLWRVSRRALQFGGRVPYRDDRSGADGADHGDLGGALGLCRKRPAAHRPQSLPHALAFDRDLRGFLHKRKNGKLHRCRRGAGLAVSRLTEPGAPIGPAWNKLPEKLFAEFPPVLPERRME